MDLIIRSLQENGINDTAQIYCVVDLILAALHDSSIHRAAEEISNMDEAKLKLVVQQVLGSS
jgi:hypothetical protein